jgi:hypothetical protein
MAYKAVPIGPGENEVRFRFESRLFSFLSLLLALNSALWVAVTFAAAARLATDAR